LKFFDTQMQISNKKRKFANGLKMREKGEQATTAVMSLDIK